MIFQNWKEVCGEYLAVACQVAVKVASLGSRVDRNNQLDRIVYKRGNVEDGGDCATITTT